MRGVALFQCPTTLLAQVDASVGGKVAVDLPAGKNLMGAFHFPDAVIVDPAVLSTLPERELACGMAEMLKHGALFSDEHFQQVQESADAIYASAAQIPASPGRRGRPGPARRELTRGSAGHGTAASFSTDDVTGAWRCRTSVRRILLDLRVKL